MRGYDRSATKSTEKFTDVPWDSCNLDELAREGACRMLKAALEQEIEEFLGRGYYERKGSFTGYRNGYGKTRKVAMGSGTVEIRAPRIRSNAKPFQSGILRSYQRQSDGVKQLIPELYLHGLATGDFELAMRGLLGDGASLSASSVCRLKEQWASEYDIWRKRSLKGHSYAYLWCDGIYPKAGLAEDKTSLLVVLGVNEHGQKEALTIYEGYRESTESWLAVLRDLKARGLPAPRIFIGDGALGLWAAIREVYPQADEQRCWVHKMRNVLNCFPKRLQGEVKTRLREMYYASTKEQSLALMKVFAADYGNEYPRGVECLLKDQDQLLIYFGYPQAHWQSLKTTNPIESIFSPVKLRTNAARRIKSPRSALYLIYALIIRAQKRWRRINAPELINDVIAGVKFDNGIKIKTKKQKKAAA